MDTGQTNSSGQSDSSKKSPLESLSREDLVKKCKSLLTIAQKAKLAKDEFAEENRKLKDELQKFETQKNADKQSLMAMKEIVESLTEHKLKLTTELTGLQSRNSKLEAEMKTSQAEMESLSIENEGLKRQVQRLTNENEDLLADLDNMEGKLKQVNEFGIQQQKDLVLLEEEATKWKNFESLANELQSKLDTMTQERDGLIREKADASKEISKLQDVNQKQSERIERFKTRLTDVVKKLRKLKECKRVLLETQHEYADAVGKWQKDIVNASAQLLKHIKHLEEGNNAEGPIGRDVLAEQLPILTEICDRVVLEFKEKTDLVDKLAAEVDSLREKLEVREAENQRLNVKVEELEASVNDKESRNSDLLDEMRELNEALKGRGDLISRQQERIQELETEATRTADALARIEANLTEKDKEISEKETRITLMNAEISSAKDEVQKASDRTRENERVIKNLSEEMSAIREREETMSTSTISRIDEVNRLREVDDSFEEKYNKLKALAVKLKRKVQEQAAQIAALESDSGRQQLKNLQALQNDNDKLLDELEKHKKDDKEKEKTLTELREKLQQMNGIEGEKTKVELAWKDCQGQVKLLKQENESFNLVRKEIEKERDTLKRELATKDGELTANKKQLEKLKVDLERSKAAGKQSNVLNLEIQAYEKSLNETAEKLKEKLAQIKELEADVTSKDIANESLRKEIQLLEENLTNEREHSTQLKHQIDVQQAKFKESEHEKQDLAVKIQELTTECETLKSQLDDFRLQISESTTERDKICNSFRGEKDTLLRQLMELEEKFDALLEKHKNTERSLEDLQAEYVSYKIKAQSVLRQNQSKESSRERELEEELRAVQVQTEILNSKLKDAVEKLDAKERKMDDLREENLRVQKRCKELIELLEESRLQNDALLEDNRKQNESYQETLKSHRLQIDTINACYKKQIDDLEKKHAQDVEEVQKLKAIEASKMTSRLAPFGGPQKTVDEQKIDLLLMEREDAEGSESESLAMPPLRKISHRSKHDMIPLDELLNSSFDETFSRGDVEERPISPSIELQATKERLQLQENRAKHLTSLLAETEQDLAKLTQLNEVLKEEVRRHERTLEREKHMHNSEYLKNVVLKFITLSSGDERTRLVPVLNTILKLSPDEAQALQKVARSGKVSDVNNRSWGSFLPGWSSSPSANNNT